MVAGTLGYPLIEGRHWSYFDALYMTVITLTTIGYGETHPLSPAGRAFTMFLALSGVFTLFFTATEIVRAMISGQVEALLGRRRMERSLADIHEHIVVCGYGRMGRLVCQEFSSQGLPFAVIEINEELLEDFQVPHGLPLHGDCTSDEVLQHAGVARARALIATVGSDADNLYTTLSARLLNPKLFIVARAEDSRSEQKLLRAGANRVVSPYVIGGTRLAQAALRPTVVDFIELATRTEHLELQIEEMQVAAVSPLAQATVKDSRLRQEFGVIIVAIKKPSGKMVFNPAPETKLEAGDILIAIGGREQLDLLKKTATHVTR